MLVQIKKKNTHNGPNSLPYKRNSNDSTFAINDVMYDFVDQWRLWRSCVNVLPRQSLRTLKAWIRLISVLSLYAILLVPIVCVLVSLLLCAMCWSQSGKSAEFETRIKPRV